MTDERTLEAITRVELDDQRNSFELKLQCAGDGVGASMLVTSSPDSFARTPGRQGGQFIHYSVRYGNHQAINRRETDRNTKFSNVINLNFPANAYMPELLKIALAANPNLDFLIEKGLVKFEEGFAGTFDDLVSSDIVRLKFGLAHSDGQIVSFRPAAPSLRPFFNDCLKVMDSPTFLKK